jgi:hypothetical protein
MNYRMVLQQILKYSLEHGHGTFPPVKNFVWGPDWENHMASLGVQLSILKKVVLYYACSCNMSLQMIVTMEEPFYTMLSSVGMSRLLGYS